MIWRIGLSNLKVSLVIIFINIMYFIWLAFSKPSQNKHQNISILIKLKSLIFLLKNFCMWYFAGRIYNSETRNIPWNKDAWSPPARLLPLNHHSFSLWSPAVHSKLWLHVTLLQTPALQWLIPPQSALTACGTPMAHAINLSPRHLRGRGEELPPWRVCKGGCCSFRRCRVAVAALRDAGG